MPKQPKKSLSIVDRRRRAAQLRRSGATLESVATVISREFKLPNYDRRRCHEDIQFALAELHREYSLDSESLRQEHLQILDRLQMALWSKALGGDVKAIDSITRLLERKSKLCGLDAPVQLLVEKSLDHEIELVFQALERSLHHEAYVQVLQIVSSMGEKS
jgi:hypothetical protein